MIIIQLDDVYEYAAHNTGELTSIEVTPAYGFLSTVNATDLPDIQVFIFYYKKNSTKLKGYLGSYKKSIAQALIKENENHDVAYIAVSKAHPKSRGYVTLDSPSPYDKPIIVPEYFTNAEDVETSIRGIKQQISFTNTPAYQKNGAEFIHIPIDECDRFDFQSDDYFRCYIKYFGSGDNHPVGTSKMRPDLDSDAVVLLKICDKMMVG
ncbi:glucose dehydrogenase [FAD, quinone]-like [Contarinia nasturtii]|uniref:glucose dehydrogenase [FAD, quinone]-like n=1 Tax=Contarinia nasturtii TaxID=265458 RepID=UPI0012D40F43|nr:glucose dehydrogenase [FAD, quinone]-like [Contarinia nasturtii]